MSSDIDHPDPEDMFKDTRMSFGDHIEDLRSHLLRALKGFVIGMVLGMWPLGPWVLGIIVAPVEEQLYQFEKRKLKKDMAEATAKAERNNLVLPRIKSVVRVDKVQLQEALDLKPKEQPLLNGMMHGVEGILADLEVDNLLTDQTRKHSNFVDINMEIVDPLAYADRVMKLQQEISRKQLATMHITESFMVYFKIAMMTGLVISSPWVFYHIWMFIAAGLYPHEKKLVNIYLPFSLFLFIAGVVVCQFIVMPKAIEAMLWFNEWLGLSAELRLNEWLGFALMMPIVFGASFQTPLVMMFFHKVGLLTVQTYRDYRRMSWFLMAVFAAVITPSVDAMSMLFLWVPMGALYELGILLCIWQGKQEQLAEWEQEEKSNELVEV